MEDLTKIPTPLLFDLKLENQEWPPHWGGPPFLIWYGMSFLQKGNIVITFMKKTENFLMLKIVLKASAVKKC